MTCSSNEHSAAETRGGDPVALDWVQSIRHKRALLLGPRHRVENESPENGDLVVNLTSCQSILSRPFNASE